MFDDQYFDNLFTKSVSRGDDPWGIEFRAYSKLCLKKAVFACQRIVQKGGGCEIGCATGYLIKQITGSMRGENRFYGVDTSSVAVEFCKKKFTNGTYSFLQGSLPNVVLPEKVDFVICNNVLQYFERDKHDAIFNNIHSLLKSDGIFFMMTPLKNKNAKELIQQLSVYFDVCAVDYVYGALDYFLIEKKCSNLVNEYYFGNIGDVRFRSVKKILGWVSYSLMKSKSLSGFLFWVNKYFLPFWKSHMICECKNRN